MLPKGQHDVVLVDRVLAFDAPAFVLRAVHRLRLTPRCTTELRQLRGELAQGELAQGELAISGFDPKDLRAMGWLVYPFASVYFIFSSELKRVNLQYDLHSTNVLVKLTYR